MDDDYEILPHKLLEDLKYDVEALKNKLSQPDNKIQELLLEIESLKDSLHELTAVFNKALEQSGEEDLGKLLKSVVSQNETIARGMIAISDKLEDFMGRNKATIMPTTMPRPVSASLPPAAHQQAYTGVRHTIGMPPTSGPGKVAPMPQMPGMSFGIDNDFPPPPPGMAKKRGGIFS